MIYLFWSNHVRAAVGIYTWPQRGGVVRSVTWNQHYLSDAICITAEALWLASSVKLQIVCYQLRSICQAIRQWME
jgi:hypothetical protein